MTPPATVRADLFPHLIDGWTGPVRLETDTVDYAVVAWARLSATPGPRFLVASCTEPSVTLYAVPECIRLPLDRREARAQLAHVLGAGLRCPVCKGEGRVWIPEAGEYDGDHDDCAACDSSGYPRKPAPCWHLLPPNEGGSLDPAYIAHVPALLKAHAESVAGGGVGVQDILGPWRKVCDDDPDTGATWIRGRLLNPKNHGGGLWVCERVQSWRDFGWENSCVRGPDGMWLRGPETGDAGKAAADTSALAHGMALLDADGLRVPGGGGE